MANFFADRREELDLTQRDIALALGMTTTAVSCWELEKSAPRIGLAGKLAEIYKVSESRMVKEIAALSQKVLAASKEVSA